MRYYRHEVAEDDGGLSAGDIADVLELAPRRTIVQATTPHGTYTFHITGVQVSSRTGVILDLEEVTDER